MEGLPDRMTAPDSPRSSSSVRGDETVQMVGADALIDGRFELREVAGSGGVGLVYRALDRWTGADVALKLLRRARDDDRARFEREARALAALSHPHVVRYIAHGTMADGVPYLVMEWLAGETLAMRLERGPLSVAES